MAACVRTSHMVLERRNKMSTETIIKKTHQEEVDAYAELLSILSEEEKERILMMVETAKMLKFTMNTMQRENLKKTQKGA